MPSVDYSLPYRLFRKSVAVLPIKEVGSRYALDFQGCPLDTEALKIKIEEVAEGIYRDCGYHERGIRFDVFIEKMLDQILKAKFPGDAIHSTLPGGRSIFLIKTSSFFSADALLREFHRKGIRQLIQEGADLDWAAVCSDYPDLKEDFPDGPEKILQSFEKPEGALSLGAGFGSDGSFSLPGEVSSKPPTVQSVFNVPQSREAAKPKRRFLAELIKNQNFSNDLEEASMFDRPHRVDALKAPNDTLDKDLAALEMYKAARREIDIHFAAGDRANLAKVLVGENNQGLPPPVNQEAGSDDSVFGFKGIVDQSDHDQESTNGTIANFEGSGRDGKEPRLAGDLGALGGFSLDFIGVSEAHSTSHSRTHAGSMDQEPTSLATEDPFKITEKTGSSIDGMPPMSQEDNDLRPSRSNEEETAFLFGGGSFGEAALASPRQPERDDAPTSDSANTAHEGTGMPVGLGTETSGSDTTNNQPLITSLWGGSSIVEPNQWTEAPKASQSNEFVFLPTEHKEPAQSDQADSLPPSQFDLISESNRIDEGKSSAAESLLPSPYGTEPQSSPQNVNSSGVGLTELPSSNSEPDDDGSLPPNPYETRDAKSGPITPLATSAPQIYSRTSIESPTTPMEQTGHVSFGNSPERQGAHKPTSPIFEFNHSPNGDRHSALEEIPNEGHFPESTSSGFPELTAVSTSSANGVAHPDAPGSQIEPFSFGKEEISEQNPEGVGLDDSPALGDVFSSDDANNDRHKK